MKAAAFAYARATSVVNALELLAEHGDKAKVLSGGQSLMPAMNLRLVSPELIVDIGELAELRGIAVKGDVLSIGALTRHVDLQKSPEIATHARRCLRTRLFTSPIPQSAIVGRSAAVLRTPIRHPNCRLA
jgi:carbon-monoxide dehydrogenase medium subunit